MRGALLLNIRFSDSRQRAIVWQYAVCLGLPSHPLARVGPFDRAC